MTSDPSSSSDPSGSSGSGDPSGSGSSGDPSGIGGPSSPADIDGIDGPTGSRGIGGSRRPADSRGSDDFHAVLHSLRVWDGPLPSFDRSTAPAEPLPLFREWFTHAAAAGQPEPHTMSLATVDADGRPDVRTLMLHDADERGWHFASHSTSAKGRQLAGRPEAALGFYWPAVARQIRLRGHVTACGAAESRADLAVRSRGALAAALTGRQSEVLSSPEELARVSAESWDRAGAEPDAPAPTWTKYVLAPTEVEFFQGDATRRHTRLRYTRTPTTPWTRHLLWP